MGVGVCRGGVCECGWVGGYELASSLYFLFTFCFFTSYLVKPHSTCNPLLLKLWLKEKNYVSVLFPLDVEMPTIMMLAWTLLL